MTSPPSLQRLRLVGTKQWTHSIGRLPVIRPQCGVSGGSPSAPVTTILLSDEYGRSAGIPAVRHPAYRSRPRMSWTKFDNAGRRAISGGPHGREDTEHRAFGLALLHPLSDLLFAEAENAATNCRGSSGDRNRNTEKRGEAWK